MKKLLLILTISLLANTANAAVNVEQFRYIQYDACMQRGRTPSNAREAGASKSVYCNRVAWEVFIRAHNIKVSDSGGFSFKAEELVEPIPFEIERHIEPAERFVIASFQDNKRKAREAREYEIDLAIWACENNGDIAACSKVYGVPLLLLVLLMGGVVWLIVFAVKKAKKHQNKKK